MANTKISALTALTNPTGNEELVYAYNNANGKMTLDTMKTFASADSQATLVSGVNIKTINGDSILGSGNLVVSGGGGGGGFEPTELGGDANIWELSEGAYITTHDLYYKTGEALPAFLGSGAVKKRMLFVVVDSSDNRGYFAYSADSRSPYSYGMYAGFGYSKSSSDGNFKELGRWDASLRQYAMSIGSTNSHPDAFTDSTISQNITNIDDNGTNTLRFSSSYPGYAGVTYTLLISSVASGETYSITLGNGVTNPLNIALPTNSNKPCVITVLAITSTTGIVTGCTMGS